MKIFVIQAYGGEATDGQVVEFTVNAESAAEAAELVHASPEGRQFGRFEVVEESDEFHGDEPGIVSRHDGRHRQIL